MREAAFIKRNQERWQTFEKLVADPAAAPDKLSDLFIQITDDLAFSRTQYPDSRTTQYLNSLTAKVHLQIYKNRREETSRFITFWKQEVPMAYHAARKPMLYAAVFFVVSGIIGAVSALQDDTFVRLILGDGYVNMTLENIKAGNPTRVYSSHDEATLFFFIAWNNILVAFITFINGVFLSVGTVYHLFRNGLMVGTFVAFFYQEQQLSQALPVIMLHGTIELTSIVLAGAAGLVMGNSFLFPGTFSRLTSFKRGAMHGMKMVVGLVPFFIIAAFIEGVITRYAFMHWALKAIVISLSAFAMIYYFVIYPSRLNGNSHPH